MQVVNGDDIRENPWGIFDARPSNGSKSAAIDWLRGDASLSKIEIIRSGHRIFKCRVRSTEGEATQTKAAEGRLTNGQENDQEPGS
jgi:hypothetical protein